MASHTLTARRPDVAEANARLGAIYFLVVEAVFFIGLIFFAGYIRSRFASWPPPGAPVPNRALLFGNVLVLLVSAACAVWAGRQARSGRRGWAQVGFLAALASGSLFLYGQWSEYARMGGWHPRESMFRTLFDSLAAVHGAHVAIGLVLLVMLVMLLRGSADGPPRHAVLLAGVWYWLFVALTWPVLLAVLTLPS